MSPHSAPSAALVTGATGFVGGNLAVGLLLAGCPRVACLVRPGDDPTGRLHRALLAVADAAGVDLAPHLDRVVAVSGDLDVEGLGLGPADRAVLGDIAPTACWHAAASLRYEDRHRDTILATNVDGTQRVLDAAVDLGIADLHHVSTAYVAGTRTGDIPEGPVDRSFGPNNWYELSKRRGEEAVAARATSFRRTRILRPSIVIGSTVTHRSTSTTGYYGFLDGLAAFAAMGEHDRLGAAARPPVRLVLEPSCGLDLVPVDLLVADALAGSAPDAPIAGVVHAGVEYVHLTNPFGVRLARLRIGPERSIDGLRLEFVHSRSDLSGHDLLLDDALDFYRPYLRHDQHFLRRRDAGSPPRRLELSDDDLVLFSRHHLGLPPVAAG